MLKNGSHSAHDLQRHKVLTQRIYGIWYDVDQAIELKLTPRVGGAKIKVCAVHDLSVIQKIATFCGLDSSPKRTHWEGFDLITNLEREDEYSFVNGLVNMPNNRRRNSADLRVLGNFAHLDFFHYDFRQKEMRQYKSGSMILTYKRTG